MTISRRARSRAAAGAFASILALSAVPAQEAPPTLRLSLEDAIERARGSSSSIAERRALEDAADARMRGAHAQRYPEMSVTAGYTRNSDVPEFSTPGTPLSPPEVIFPSLPNQFRSRIAVAVPIWTGGRVEGGIEAAEGARRASSFDRASVDEDVALETSVAYWTLVSAREQERVLVESVRAYEAHMKDAQDRVDVGMAARNDVLAVQSDRDEAELGRLRAASASRVAEANLARLLQAPPGTHIEPVEPLEAALVPPADVEALVTEALRSRFDRQAAAARVDAAAARIDIERSGRRPRIAASAGYDYSNPNSKVLPPADAWHDTWDVGVGVAFTVLDGGRTSAAVAASEADARAARERLESLDRGIRLEVTQAAVELDTAHASAELTLRSLEAAQENVRVSSDRYREGLLSTSDLLDAENALLRAGLARTRALVQVRTASAELARASGRPVR